MSVFKKLQQAKNQLQGVKMEKSGHNKFAGYKYFELGDFLPHVVKILHEVGLCSVVAFTPETASLSIVDTESGESVLFTSPMVESQMKGALPIQNLGAVQTYQRRYLFMMALDIVEHDAIDSVGGKGEKKTITPNDGAGEDVSDSRKDYIADMATAIEEAFSGDNLEAAYALYSELQTQEEKRFLWSLLGSKVRAAIKKRGEELRNGKE